jgi:pimeloyl-ACP methyl ester carboxylesterase
MHHRPGQGQSLPHPGRVGGSKVAFKYPEDYYAYIGVSQVVSPTLAVKIGYEWLENMVISNANNKDKEKLQELGPPPYNDHSDFVSFIHLVDKYGGGMDVSFLKLALIAVSAPEYNFSDYFKWVRGSSRGSGPMWETTQCFNLFSEVPSLDIPAYFFSGAKDYNTPLALLEEFIGKLEAPEGKELVVFSN